MRNKFVDIYNLALTLLVLACYECTTRMCRFYSVEPLICDCVKLYVRLISNQILLIVDTLAYPKVNCFKESYYILLGQSREEIYFCVI